MKITSKIVLGAILVFIGITFFLETSGLLSYLNLNAWTIIWLLWPLFFLGMGIRMILNQNITAGIVFTSLGIIFLLTQLFHWGFFSVLWPVILIAIGLSVIFRKENAHFNSGKKYDSSDKISDTVLFWGLDKKVDAKAFKGGEINAVFGGVKIDLREAKINKSGAKIIANAAFGGIEILVPKDCRIVADGIGIFGGWENKIASRDTKEPALEITGTAVFGGVEIKE